jgi:single-stranded-DNA-specific exonuclease
VAFLAATARELDQLMPPRILRRPVPTIGDWPEHVPDVLRRVYAARGVLSHAESELRLADLLPPDALGGIEAASALLTDAIRNDRRIVIVGDFDCDGATGTAVGVRGLRLLGARNVAYQVPHRVLHGYGLSPVLVEAMLPLQPELVITVDNGIACLAGVAAARALGWRVLITDHHLPGAQLPDANAIVNPNCVQVEQCGHGSPLCDRCAQDVRMNIDFPSKALAGVGVLFYLLLATRRVLREQRWFEDARFAGAIPDLSTLLDLVAVGTVADLVPLDTNNRRMVAAGLHRLRRGQCQPGLRALAEVAGRRLDQLTTSDIGFAIAPRLNAAGRLEDMALGIECLLADDASRALELAQILDGINAERRGLQQLMVEDADELLRHTTDRDANAICVFDKSWHPGVIGLVASKLKDRLHRPVIAFAPAEPSTNERCCDELRGSARSIAGFHIRDALVAVDAARPGLITRFGGHAMAAGLILQRKNLDDFIGAFIAHASATLDPALLQQDVLSDGPLTANEISRDTAQALRMAGPWGQGFAEPVFDNVFVVTQWRVLGARHLKMTLIPEQGGPPISAIHFGGYAGESPPARIRAAYQLELDDFRGRRDVQLLIRQWQPA